MAMAESNSIGLATIMGPSAKQPKLHVMSVRAGNTRRLRCCVDLISHVTRGLRTSLHVMRRRVQLNKQRIYVRVKIVDSKNPFVHCLLPCLILSSQPSPPTALHLPLDCTSAAVMDVSDTSRASSVASSSPSMSAEAPMQTATAKRTRKRFTAEQLMILEDIFHRTSHPTREERETAARQTGM
jgi:hypothetical protein